MNERGVKMANSKTKQAEHDDVWDDTALLKAYDDALKGVTRKSSKRRKVQEKQDIEGAEAEEEGSVETRDEEAALQEATAPLPAPGLDATQVDDELRGVLQAYFNAGSALGRYMASR